MIVKMKKVSLFVREKELRPSVRSLRKFGLMHLTVESGKTGKSELLHEQTQQLQAVLYAMQELQNEKKASLIDKNISTNEVFSRIEGLSEDIKERNKLQETIQKQQLLLQDLKPWGDFDPALFHYLYSNGIKINLFTILEKELEAVIVNFDVVILKKEGKLVRVAILGDKLPDVGGAVTAFKIPELSITQVNQYIDDLQNKISLINKKLLDELPYIKAYQLALKVINQEQQFESVVSTVECDGPVAWITGFLPAKSVPQLSALASSESWGLIIEDPSDEDPVPTELENNKVVRIIQPVFDILGTVPGYKEFDISLFFLMFFAVFFAMIVGDGGYGLLFLGITIGLHVKTRKLVDALKLLYVLSVSTIIWGAITGTWFGSQTIVKDVIFLQRMVIPEIASFPGIFEVTDTVAQQTLMYICFVIGIMHLSIACIMSFLRRFPGLDAFAQLGWLSMLIGLYNLVLNLVIGVDFPLWALYGIIAGFVLVVVFGAQEKDQKFHIGLIKGFAGLFTTFLDTISSFSNIISYIRLFAVGMASVAIASSFNAMAEPFLGGWAFPAAVLILLVGHGLNFAMGLLSVVVHGVRLNMLEFSGQLGMEWTGIKYDPFRETVETEITAVSPTNS